MLDEAEISREAMIKIFVSGQICTDPAAASSSQSMSYEQFLLCCTALVWRYRNGDYFKDKQALLNFYKTKLERCHTGTPLDVRQLIFSKCGWTMESFYVCGCVLKLL